MENNIIFGFTPTHPGEILKDEIEYRKLSQVKLAKQMGISYKILNDILNGRRPVTTTTAMMFEAALDVPAYSLINIQTKYNMQVASSDKSLMKRLAEIRKMSAIF
ncbi:MAG: HigA family addiction module antidote protein [Dysgonamonadaceae bacterium]|jgi:addiction module HigA family antidote|nr:HigA family addiction module antidote protein [Dysgonamonadaceae bacterium]